MTFTSIDFIFFFPIIVALFYLCPIRFRWAVLLAGSCYFYMAFVPQYIFILFFLVIADFILAQKIEATSGPLRHAYYVASLVANIGVLFVFKYFNFFNANVAELAHFIHWNYSLGYLKLALPLGLSFHTFQSISYVTEVYRRKYKAERHIGMYALYVFFFPQLIAGPIERPGHLLPQLKNLHARFNWARVFSGLRLMAWGFFKKLVIADSLSRLVDFVYGNVNHSSGPTIAVAGVAFAFQLYADFSGYSDIARGSARVLGVDVVRNFLQPYFSSSVQEFWQRWHISLSSWFRDYLYYPFVSGGKRITPTRIYMGVLLTFLLMGVWHGAGWTFVMLGVLHGTYISVGTFTKKWREKVAALIGLSKLPRLHHTLQVLCVFMLVSISWVFFRAPNLQTALTFLGHLGSGWLIPPMSYLNAYALYPFLALGISRSALWSTAAFAVVMLLVEHKEQTQPIGTWLATRSPATRSFAYASVLLVITLFGVFATNPFIYFQF
jgi:alginate O-acetyltransferase complex protein AlgI